MSLGLSLRGGCRDGPGAGRFAPAGAGIRLSGWPEYSPGGRQANAESNRLARAPEGGARFFPVVTRFARDRFPRKQLRPVDAFPSIRPAEPFTLSECGRGH